MLGGKYLKRTNYQHLLVVLGAILVQVSLGTVYTWSLFNQPLIDKFGWPKADIVLTFSITIAIFAFATIISGKIQDKIGPKWVATIGGILLGTGLLLSSRATTLVELYFYYGIIGGLGIGTAYVCPLATCVKWFPNNKGFITGVVVGAFGLGSLIFKNVIIYLINTKGVSESFAYLGVIYMLLILVGAQFLILPPVNHKNFSKNNSPSIGSRDYAVTEMITTLPFYLIWFMFFLGCISGLMIIGLAKDIGIDLVMLTPEAAANAVGVIAIFNALGRVFWGTISDSIGRVISIVLMYLLTSGAMLFLSVGTLNYETFFIAISLIGFSFGGFLAVFPAITADYYGIKNLGVNYGIVYQAYGLAAIIGPIIGSSIPFKNSFLLASSLAVIGIILSMLLKLKKHT